MGCGNSRSSRNERTTSNFWYPSAIPAWGCPQGRRTRYSMRSSPPNLTAPAWGCGSAAPSLNRTAVACGLPTPLPAARVFISLCPIESRQRNDPAMLCLRSLLPGLPKELGLTQHFLRRKICEASGEHPPSLDGAGFVHCDSWAARNHFGGVDLDAGLPCHEPLADTPRQLSRPAQNCRRQWARLRADRLRFSPSWELSEFSSRADVAPLSRRENLADDGYLPMRISRTHRRSSPCEGAAE